MAGFRSSEKRGWNDVQGVAYIDKETHGENKLGE